jgi:hypothetical protein
MISYSFTISMALAEVSRTWCICTRTFGLRSPKRFSADCTFEAPTAAEE